MATVTADGTNPSGAGDLTFDIKFSTGITQTAFETIMGSTWALQIQSGSCWDDTTNFRDTNLDTGDVLRLDITGIGATNPGGDPICVTIYGRQQ